MRNKLMLVLTLVLSLCGAAHAQTLGYEVIKVNYKNLVANLYLPKLAGKVPVVIAIGGSEGGLSTGDANGKMMAPYGIAVLGLAYFKDKGLPDTLDQIPMEYFTTAVDYLATVPAVDASRIGMVGGSRGAEATLLFASFEPRIRSVVATTPSSAAWYGRTLAKSAWTRNGKDVPASRLGLDEQAPVLSRFAAALDDREKIGAATFAVENINGPVFLVSAEQDQVWPSQRMSLDIVDRLRQHNFRFPVTHRSYPTGHGFSQQTVPEIKQSIIDHFLHTL